MSSARQDCSFLLKTECCKKLAAGNMFDDFFVLCAWLKLIKYNKLVYLFALS